MQLLVFHYSSEINRDLSYQHGWPRALAKSMRVATQFVNLADNWMRSKNIRSIFFDHHDAIVLLHSVFSNARFMPRTLQYLIRLRQLPVVYFIGNEYKSMPQKMQFCERLGVSLLVSQAFHKEVIDLYRARLGCSVMSIPSGGLDPDLITPGPPIIDRQIDVGFRAYDEPAYFGHQERRTLMTRTLELCPRLGLSSDLSMDSKERLIEANWANFLHRCKTMIGTYSGYDHFELDDATRLKVNAYGRKHPRATFADIYREFFKDKPKGVTARMLSGRHIEAAGTKTAQILVEGYYSGFFQPNEHYIPVRPDLTNLEEALEKSKDSAFCQSIADKAYTVATQELTFDRHIDRLCNALEPLCN